MATKVIWVRVKEEEFAEMEKRKGTRTWAEVIRKGLQMPQPRVMDSATVQAMIDETVENLERRLRGGQH